MFGMDKNKKKKGPAIAEFDLEQQLKDPKEIRQMQARIDGRVQQLKASLRAGTDKKGFDDVQTLLHGYLASQKVIGRLGK